MKPWKMAFVGLVLLAIAGCRSDPAVPILERELRLKEDEIYRLRARLDETQDCGSSCSDRVVNDSRSTSTSPVEPEIPSRRRRGSDVPNGIAPPSIDLPSSPTSTVPAILDPQKTAPADRSSKRLIDRSTPSDSDGPTLERDLGDASSRPGRTIMASRSASAEPFTPSGDSRQVASIVLNHILTGGISEGAGSGDQGILVVVEPRDRNGRTVDAPAEISVVVIDPAVEGPSARVARWDFTPAETAALFRRTGSSQAIHLTTAWPADPPIHNKLHLFVRYVTADGRKLQADQPIEVALEGDRTARWNRNQEPTERLRSEVQQQHETPAPHIAARSEEPKSRRPVWSPDRQ